MGVNGVRIRPVTARPTSQ